MTNLVTGRMGTLVGDRCGYAALSNGQAMRGKKRKGEIHEMVGFQHLFGAIAHLVQRLVCGHLRAKVDSGLPARSRGVALAGSRFVSRDAWRHSFHGSPSERISGNRRHGLYRYNSLRIFLFRVSVWSIRELRAAKYNSRVLGIDRILCGGCLEQRQHSIHIRTGARSRTGARR